MAGDTVEHFFCEAHHLTSEAKFIINSIPNAEIRAVESIVHKLYAVPNILQDLVDPASTAEQLEYLVSYVESCIHPLEEFMENPPPLPSAYIPKTHTGGRGHPAYDLDLSRAILLHNLGLSWDSIAKAMGCVRKTLFNHLEKAGLTDAASKQPYTEISDVDLDQIFSQIVQEHPFIGSVIALGHLKSRWEIHVPIRRVQDSFRRVDSVGVTSR